MCPALNDSNLPLGVSDPSPANSPCSSRGESPSMSRPQVRLPQALTGLKRQGEGGVFQVVKVRSKASSDTRLKASSDTQLTVTASTVYFPGSRGTWVHCSRALPCGRPCPPSGIPRPSIPRRGDSPKNPGHGAGSFSGSLSLKEVGESRDQGSQPAGN